MILVDVPSFCFYYQNNVLVKKQKTSTIVLNLPKSYETDKHIVLLKVIGFQPYYHRIEKEHIQEYKRYFEKSLDHCAVDMSTLLKSVKLSGLVDEDYAQVVINDQKIVFPKPKGYMVTAAILIRKLNMEPKVEYKYELHLISRAEIKIVANIEIEKNLCGSMIPRLTDKLMGNRGVSIIIEHVQNKAVMRIHQNSIVRTKPYLNILHSRRNKHWFTNDDMKQILMMILLIAPSIKSMRSWISRLGKPHELTIHLNDIESIIMVEHQALQRSGDNILTQLKKDMNRIKYYTETRESEYESIDDIIEFCDTITTSYNTNCTGAQNTMTSINYYLRYQLYFLCTQTFMNLIFEQIHKVLYKITTEDDEIDTIQIKHDSTSDVNFVFEQTSDKFNKVLRVNNLGFDLYDDFFENKVGSVKINTLFYFNHLKVYDCRVKISCS